MRTEQITVTYYDLNELNPKAYETAYNEFLNKEYYPYVSDNGHTLIEFCKLFNINVESYCYSDDLYINSDLSKPRMEFNLSGVRLLKYLYNNYFGQLFSGKYYWIKCDKFRQSKIMLDTNCVLTGYYLDNEILAPIYNFMLRPTNKTLRELISECLNAWLKSCKEDYENFFSYEHFEELSTENKCEYDIDGNLL